MLQLWALLERANVAIYLALDAPFDTLITRCKSANGTPFRFYCVFIKTQNCDAYFVHAQSVRRRMALYATLLRQI